MKYTRFQDVPKYIQSGDYECDYDLHRVWPVVSEWMAKDCYGLDIDPDFQRVHVWTEAQQVAWLEHVLRHGKSGRVLYFNKPSWGGKRTAKYDDFVLVDGKQRLEAIRRFSLNEIRVFGSYFSEYTDSPRICSTIKFNVNDLPRKRDVLKWYLQMNAGGTPHTDEEIARVAQMLNEAEA